MIAKEIVILLCNTPWDWTTDYCRQTAEELARRQRVVVCILWEDGLSLKELLTRKKKFTYISTHDNYVYLYSPLYIIPFHSLSVVRVLNSMITILLIRLFVMAMQIRYGIRSVVVWVFNPNYYSLVARFPRTYFVIYDCVDYFSMGVNTCDVERVRLQEMLLLKRANLVVTISHVLKERLQRLRKKVRLVPQGFNDDIYRTHIQSERQNISFINDRPNMLIIGFIGAMNERLDYKLLHSLVSRNPQWLFIFWGPIHSEGRNAGFHQEIRALYHYPNVIHGESRNKQEIPSIVNQFDIGIIPYDTRLDCNKYCYPAKIFEYFYLGKPVVSTPIEELKRFSRIIRFGEDVLMWEKHINEVFLGKWSVSLRRQQRRLAQQNNWKHKISYALSALYNIQETVR